MDPDVLSFAQVAAVIVLSVGSLAAIGTLTARALMRTKRDALPRGQHDDARLDQIQQSVEAIAVEVERIAEAQRFNARLLAERTGAPEPPR
ncbi:MAG TPA: hypothetical protein VGT98_04215 [Candidatus Elarobacter sp.]|nr:hypothetical protein [Candidatus Elarobacter sp.]